jgi:hypothetical protein
MKIAWSFSIVFVCLPGRIVSATLQWPAMDHGSEAPGKDGTPGCKNLGKSCVDLSMDTRPGKHTKNSYGKITMLLMGKSTINGHFQ